MKIIYCRKSSEPEDRQVQSIPAQLERCRNYAKNLNFEIYEEITEAVSAKAPGRPGFNKMVELIKKGKADGIICWELNRISRNSYDEGIIKRAVQQGEIKEIHATTGICTNENILMMSIFFGMSTQYLIDLARSVKRGMKQKADAGGATSKAKIGYKNNKETHEWEIDKEKAKIVEEIFELRKRKIGFGKIGEILFKKGIKTRYGRPYSSGYIEAIIKDDVYLGIKNFKGQKIQGKHKPIISNTLWEEANGARIPNVVSLDINHSQFIFKGKIRYQNKAMSPYVKKGNIYYREGQRVTPPFNISQKKLIELLQSEFEQISFPDEFKEFFVNGLLNFFNERNKSYKNELLQKEREINELKEENKELGRKNAKGILEDEIMIELHNENMERVKNLTGEIERIKDVESITLGETHELLEMLIESQKEFKNGNLEQKMKIINLTTHELFFDNKKQLSFVFTKPFQVLQKMQFL